MQCSSLWAPSQYQGTSGILLVKLEQLRLGALEDKGFHLFRSRSLVRIQAFNSFNIPFRKTVILGIWGTKLRVLLGIWNGYRASS